MAQANFLPNSSPQDDDDSDNCLRVLLLGRTGRGKSTTGNKLLKAGGVSVLPGSNIKKFDEGTGAESCTREIVSLRSPSGTDEAKGVHVVDTPGFADSNALESVGVYQSNLALFRDLIRKQVNEKLRFHRVLYFLPCRGPLETADAVLQEELQVMLHFFGKAIFECMVLVATLHKRKQSSGFDDADKEETIKIFREALMLASIVGDRIKCPPVIFIRFDDTGVNILGKIEKAEVTGNNGLTLDRFEHGTCFKCAAKYLCHEDSGPSDPEGRVGVMDPTKGEEQKDDKETCVPYQSSLCHPLFMPKHSTWEKIFGSAINFLPQGVPTKIQKLTNREHPWPTLSSKDEMCAHCYHGPGSNGCWKVGTEYKTTLPTGKNLNIIVDHTNRFEDFYSKYVHDS